jgi:NAD(P)-dependent dehydrogenase (short-subunit alcohol dehydrogenase family)
MTALVTGAAKRLGRAMALRLAERGHDVAVHYAGSAEAAQATVAEIRAMGRTAHAVQADLTVEAEMQALLPAAAEALGRPITVLVNNASIFEYDNIRDRHPRELGQAPGIEPSRALRAEPGLGGAGPGGPARRERRAAGARPDRQHDRPARAQADAGIHELHDRQDGALGADPDLGTGAGAACTGECDRTGPDDAGRAPVGGAFRAAKAATILQRGPTPRASARRSITCCRRGP